MNRPERGRDRVIVLGAGMAGLAAAHDLHRAGVETIVLEARERIGGRTYTVRSFAGIPVEFGAEFIHGADAPTWQLVEALGLGTLHWTKRDDSLVRLEDGRLCTMREAKASDPAFQRSRSWQLPDEPARAFEDWEAYLRRIGFGSRELRYVARSFANACGEDARFLDARSMLELLGAKGAADDGDHRLLDGYDRLPTYLAEGLDIRLGHEVCSVEQCGSAVTIRTQAGGTLAAAAVVVAVPLGVLQAGTLAFSPDLPAVKQKALAGMRMGPVIKLVYRLRNAPVDETIMALYSRHNPPMWWSPSYGQAPAPHDREREVVWTAFASGSWAKQLLADGHDAALQQALRALEHEVGRKLEPIDATVVDWPADRFARGGYSYVLPGHFGARRLLARPTPPLFWAGEATAPEAAAATVHGAYASGRRAAAEVIAYLAGDSQAVLEQLQR